VDKPRYKMLRWGGRRGVPAVATHLIGPSRCSMISTRPNAVARRDRSPITGLGSAPFGPPFGRRRLRSNYELQRGKVFDLLPPNCPIHQPAVPARLILVEAEQRRGCARWLSSVEWLRFIFSTKSARSWASLAPRPVMCVDGRKQMGGLCGAFQRLLYVCAPAHRANVSRHRSVVSKRVMVCTPHSTLMHVHTHA
jgi:hypothetical protein